MSYLDTSGASDDARRHQEADVAQKGYVSNYTKLFGLAPAAYDGWLALNGSVKAGMDLRRYELVTLAVARRLRSSYCSLAHGSVLATSFFPADDVRRIATDHRDAGLEPVEVSIMDFAEKVATDATSITESDVDSLRAHGLDDREIFQIVLAAAVRCFFSTVLDATGTEPDAQFRTNLDPGLQQVLTVGRAIAAPSS
jgi:uncharacterized peroxidase-related enzyme